MKKLAIIAVLGIIGFQIFGGVEAAKLGKSAIDQRAAQLEMVMSE